MNSVGRNRQSAKKRAARRFKKGITNILLAPARMPRLTADKVDQIMRMCEGAAISFVAILMVHLAVPDVIGTTLVIVVGAIFALLMLMILLADYQDKLVEYELYGYRL